MGSMALHILHIILCLLLDDNFQHSKEVPWPPEAGHLQWSCLKWGFQIAFYNGGNGSIDHESGDCERELQGLLP